MNAEILTVIVTAVAILPALFAAIIANNQLKEMQLQKEEHENNRKVDNAITYCYRFASQVLPFYQEYKVIISKKDPQTIQFKSSIDKSVGIQDFEGISLTQQQLGILEDKKVYKVLNEMDIIAIAINKNSVDLDTCKSNIGRVFCEAVEVYIDIILAMRHENEDAFHNSIKLYKEWRPTYETVATPLNS